MGDQRVRHARTVYTGEVMSRPRAFISPSSCAAGTTVTYSCFRTCCDLTDLTPFARA